MSTSVILTKERNAKIKHESTTEKLKDATDKNIQCHKLETQSLYCTVRWEAIFCMLKPLAYFIINCPNK